MQAACANLSLLMRHLTGLILTMPAAGPAERELSPLITGYDEVGRMLLILFENGPAQTGAPADPLRDHAAHRELRFRQLGERK